MFLQMAAQQDTNGKKSKKDKKGKRNKTDKTVKKDKKDKDKDTGKSTTPKEPSEKNIPLTRLSLELLDKTQQASTQEDELEQVSASSDSSDNLIPLTAESPLEPPHENASSNTEALFGFIDCAKDVALETTVLGKRKVEEDSDRASFAGKDFIAAAKDDRASSKRETKRARGTISLEDLNAFDAGTTFLVEIRKLAEVQNESLRLHALAQFLLLHAEF
ncbi:unnamed protein product [Mortierella alpina]